MDALDLSDYEPPRLQEIGSLHELTETGRWCFKGKTIGPPDFWTIIPIANCSR